MRKQHTKATARQRIATAIVMVAVVVFFAILSAQHHGHTSGDPCANGNAPQVCEQQHKIDAQHAIENAEAETHK